MDENLMDYFNRQPRIGTLATASKDGRVDVAVYGSPRMTDERTVIIGSNTNRTLANLRENPHAVYMIIEPGAGIMDWKGVRVYMTVRSIETSGPAFEAYLDQVAAVIGEIARTMLHALVTFDVTEVRPIVDMGQDWDQPLPGA